jgi:hypothetical protein
MSTELKVGENVFESTSSASYVCPCGCGIKLLGVDDDGVVQAAIGHTPDEWLGVIIPDLIVQCRKMKGEAVN